MSLGEMSLYGGAMILVAALMRLLLRDRLPRRMYVALWDLAMLRLLVPFRLPALTSVQRVVQVAAPVWAQAVPQTLASGAEALAGDVAPAAQAGFPWKAALLALWLTGALILAVRFARLYARGRRVLAESLPCAWPQVEAFMGAHNLRRTVRVRLSSRIASPVTFGVLRPVILLPASMNTGDAETLHFVLLHEWHHIRALDALRKLAAAACLCLHWMNPTVCGMFLLVNRDMELLCDERVLARKGREARRAYAMTLLRMEEERQRVSPSAGGFSMNALEERIKAMTRMKRRGAASVLAAVMIVGGTAAALATSAPQDADAHAGQAADTVTQDVEWWTAEAYEVYMEEQRAALAQMVAAGDWGCTQTEGWFQWTQERMDETMAVHAYILGELRRGMKVSRAVNGTGEIGIQLMQSIPEDGAQDAAAEDAAVAAAGSRTPELSKKTWVQELARYAPYGLGYDEAAKRLTFGGRIVRVFEDMWPIGPGMEAGTVMQFPDGEVDVYGVRDLSAPIVRNADGSFDPRGTLLGLREATKEEFAARTREMGR